MALLFPDAPDDEFVEGSLYGAAVILRGAVVDLLVEVERSPVGEFVSRTVTALSRVLYRD